MPADIRFIGISDRADLVKSNGNWNLINFGTSLDVIVLPMELRHLYFGFSVPNAKEGFHYEMKILWNGEEERGRLTIGANPGAVMGGEEVSASKGEAMMIVLPTTWTNVFARFEGVTLNDPGVYQIILVNDTDDDVVIGEFICRVVRVPKLDEERILAIKSNRNAAKAVRMELGCKNCDSKCRAYASIERSSKIEKEGWKWFEEVSDSFKCKCGSSNVNLKYLKTNLQGLLGQAELSDNSIKFTPLYENSAVRQVRNDLSALVQAKEKEDVLQKFLESNPIVFHRLSARRIISKPRILNSFIGDFGILTNGGNLIFVEIERPNARLLKKDGHQAADLVHAFEQVRDWFSVINDHRSAVLSDLGIEVSEVSSVNGLVIAGTETDYPQTQIRRLKMVRDSDIQFWTYDDLISGLDSLISDFTKL